MPPDKLLRAEVINQTPIRQLSKAEIQQNLLKSIEDRLLQSSMEVVSASTEFAWLDPEDLETIPPEWIAELGLQEAERKHRIAKASWLPQSSAPNALATSLKIAVGIVRARAAEQSSTREMRIGEVTVNMTTPQANFPELVIDDGE